MSNKLSEANNFVEKEKVNVNKKYYPNFHLAAPHGWMNDPNGVSYYQGEYHLFYQHFPYDSVWGPMHWGHAKSKDGINWKELPIAIAPDELYDQGGCFSGSAIEKDGKLYLMYTGHLPNEEDESLTRQNQNIAVSSDGVNFKKYKNNPVLSEKNIPEGTSIVDFRDPKLFERNGIFYCVIGSKTIDNKGQVLLYKSKDLFSWEFVSVVLEYNNYLGSMVECPDLLLLDGKDVFVLSAMNYTDEETGTYYPHITWLIEGKVDWETYKFRMSDIYEMDKGIDFYAPQTTKLDDKYVAFAWMQNWRTSMPTNEKQHNWAGQMTIPRVIYKENQNIKQTFTEDILEYVVKQSHEKDILIEKNSIIATENIQYLKISFSNSDNFKIKFNNEDNESLEIKIIDKKVTFSRENTEVKVINENKEEEKFSKDLSLENLNDVEANIFIDKSSVEIFINNKLTSSNTYYIQSPINMVSIEPINKFKLREFVTGIIDL